MSASSNVPNGDLTEEEITHLVKKEIERIDKEKSSNKDSKDKNNADGSGASVTELLPGRSTNPPNVALPAPAATPTDRNIPSKTPTASSPFNGGDGSGLTGSSLVPPVAENTTNKPKTPATPGPSRSSPPGSTPTTSPDVSPPSTPPLPNSTTKILPGTTITGSNSDDMTSSTLAPPTPAETKLDVEYHDALKAYLDDKSHQNQTPKNLVEKIDEIEETNPLRVTTEMKALRDALEALINEHDAAGSSNLQPGGNKGVGIVEIDGSLAKGTLHDITESTGIVSIFLIPGIILLIILAVFVVWKRRKRQAQKLDIGSESNRKSTSLDGYRSLDASLDSPQLGKLWYDPMITTSRLPFEKVNFKSLIARGGMGEVYRGEYNSQEVAIKCLHPDKRHDVPLIVEFLEEIKLMSTLQHPRIVQYIGVAWDALSDLCVLTEYMELGDLRSLLQHFDAEGRAPGFNIEKITIALQIAHALTYLHSLSPIVLHRDLKSKNILLSRSEDNGISAKLTDFGISKQTQTTTMTTGVGTSMWMAPEVMMGDSYDEKADIFSFGVVLSELDTHRLPYEQIKGSSSISNTLTSSDGHQITNSSNPLPDTAILQMMVLGKLSVEFTGLENDPIVALGRSCVAVDPKNRPNSSELLWQLQLVQKHYARKLGSSISNNGIEIV